MKLIIKTNNKHDNYLLKANNGSSIWFNLSHNKILACIDMICLSKKLLIFLCKPSILWNYDIDYVEIDGVEVSIINEQ